MDHRAKLARAYLHLDALEDAMEAFLNKDPYLPIFERDDNASEIIIRIRANAPIPDEFPLIVGDFLYNCRAALEYLAFALVRANTPTPSKPASIFFPIFIDAHRYRKEGMPKIAEASQQALAAIEALQPYNAVNPTDTDLWRLYELSNIDRHRSLLLSGATVEDTEVLVEVDGSITVTPDAAKIAPGPFQDGAIISQFRLIGFGDSIGKTAKVNVKYNFTYRIAFAEQWPPQTELVIPALEGIHDHIRDKVFPTLEPFLK